MAILFDQTAGDKTKETKNTKYMYDGNEHAVWDIANKDIILNRRNKITLIVVGGYELYIDPATGYVEGISGYENHEYWKHQKIKLPKVKKGSVSAINMPNDVHGREHIEESIPRGLKPAGTLYDRGSLLLLIGKKARSVYQIDKGVFAGLKKGRITSLYFTGIKISDPSVMSPHRVGRS